MRSFCRCAQWSRHAALFPSPPTRPRNCLDFADRCALKASFLGPPYLRSFHSSTFSAAPSGFDYKIAAAFSGKANVFDHNKHHFLFDSETGHGSYGEAALAKRGRKIPSGQDSFFAGPIGDYEARSVAFAVADGVGGYKDSGIDSADFAHGICRYMKEAASTRKAEKKTKTKAVELLQEGYDQLCSDPQIKGGGSTACIGVAKSDGSLDVANLGDSGFVHLRMNAVSFYSEPQTHAFNTPFQLSTVPPKILAQIKNFGGAAPFCDMPADASLSSHRMHHGDVLVFATDGVWDNLTSQEVLDVVSSTMTHSGAWTAPDGHAVQVSPTIPYLTAETLSKEGHGMLPLQTRLAIEVVRKAKDASVNVKRDGPFARAVQQVYPQERWHGGKIDDICVLVVVAIDRSSG
ncbi:MAG: hypothetical protein Q9162_003503 [Coniocarpon cinnabarinum]